MSKAPKKPDTKKSKDVKGKTVSAEKQQNTTYLEIVPGKFNENDWNTLLEIDEAQEFVWELLEECIENANKTIYTNYLDKQTIPFTINEAKKAILHLIDWQFLDDDTDDDLVETWVQDKEPDACVIDSWAQGYVQTLINEPPTFEENVIEEVDEQKSRGSFLEELTQTPQFKPQFVESIPVDTMSQTQSQYLTETKSTTNSTLTNKKAPPKRFTGKKFSEPSSMNHTMPVSSKPDPSTFSYDDRSEKKELPIHLKFKQIDAEAKKLEDSIVKAPNAAQSLLKTLLTRPVGQREVEIDPYGDITSIAKLDFDKLNSTGIKARFSVNETKKPDAIHDLSSRRFHVDRNESKLKVASANSLEKSVDAKKKLAASTPRKKQTKVTEFIEEENDLVLEPVPGVVFTMLNSVRMGPKKALVPNRQQLLYDKSELFLKPIKPLERSDAFTRLSLDEILESNHEINSANKNGKTFKPIPPISHGISQH